MIFWLASYPKSGNTWIRTFISTYFFTKESSFKFDYLKNIRQFPHEKFFDYNLRNVDEAINSWDRAQKKINLENQLIFLKTHSALVNINEIPFTTKENTIAGIYVVRDPRNVVTSISNHYQINFDQSIKFMTNNKKFLINRKNRENFANFTFLNSWSEHYKSWKESKQFKVLFLKYEDLENNTFEEFKKITTFINNVIKNKKIVDEDRIKEIIHSISFEELQKKERKYGFPEAVVKNNKKIKFFYLGKKNNWKDILSHQQINILNSIFLDDLKKLDYKI